MNRPVSIGVIGIGYGQGVLVPAFRADRRCEVVGICARRPDRAREVAAKLGLPRAYDDWRAMVADPGIDAVAVAVPPVSQPEIIIAAAEAGKHVFCEKPVADDAEAARAMLQAVERAGVVHAVDFLFPEIPAWRRARQALQDGTLGGLRHFALSWRVETYAHRARLDSWKLKREGGGGALANFVSHTLYYLEWMFGPVRQLAARLTPAQAAGESCVDLWLEFEGGLPGSVAVATDAPFGPGHRLDVFGDGGTLVLENRSGDHAAGFELSVGLRADGAPVPVAVAADLPPGGPVDGRARATASIAGRFLDGIVSGAPVAPGLREGLRTQVLIDAVRSADASRAWRSV